MNLFWKIVDTLEADPTRTQVVIGLPGGSKRAERLAEMGSWLANELNGPAESQQEAQAVLVVATDSGDLGEAVFRLSEMGIKQLHAIYPRKAGSKLQAGTEELASKEGAR